MATPLNPIPSEPHYEALHIAGTADGLSAQQRDWIEIARELGRTRFAPRAERHDREASFPTENFADLRSAGMLALSVPAAYGGGGADFMSCALVVAELGRHCGSTALSYNMHVAAGLWAGQVADQLEMSAEQRADHERHRRWHFERIVRDGRLYAQPFSEGGAASAGRAPWATRARRVEGGYVVNGRKTFASLAGAADVYGVVCTLDRPGASQRDTLYLAVPADSPGVTVCGEWDSLGMRATVSRDLELHDVFVGDSARLLPEGRAWQAAQRFPYMFATLSSTYLGIAQAAYDFTVQYLRAELPGMAGVRRRMYPTKQHAVAQMRIRLEQARALFLRTIGEAGIDPDGDRRQRLLGMHYTVMETAQWLCALALRTCGGQAVTKALPLERLYRDARCGSLMLPWTAELCLDQLGRECLYAGVEGDESIE